MLPIEDLYAILGVAASASPDEIKRRYRQLVKQTHPDVLQADGSASGELFLDIRRAYEVLADARRRADYDTARAAAVRAGAAPTAGAQEVAPQTVGGGGGAGRAGGLGDFVRQFFGNTWAPDGPLDGPFAYAKPPAPPSGREANELTLTLKEAFTGRDFDIGGMRVRIPPGARHGARFRVPPPVFEVRTLIEPEPGFLVDGDDVKTEVLVEARTGVGGGEVQVGHPTGHLKVTVPAGLRDGQVLRLRGRGLPATAARRAGDLLVRVRLSK